MSPHVGKLLIYGALFGVGENALTCAACLSSKSPFLTYGPEQEKEKWCQDIYWYRNEDLVMPSTNDKKDHRKILSDVLGAM